ncbi:hypothetical protein EPUS_05077 [Endocarpon pusillum Z07020]|uniref:Histone H1 n=1 Tax=Endocarpon pusillum (strain Z07020 / HMAS-L-300199) TaxID=1263415 RepID=U1HKH0_ENDPU|nr:uncharacterized protein EPUS_05077 [Endocarpon pusillum Z07020]ERF70725.1 hypothetical protein EPUS_05077 [Endocarpon pusillum Z07020]
MPAKKAAAPAPKKAAATPAHASYKDMIKEAILNVSQFSLRQGASIGPLLRTTAPITINMPSFNALKDRTGSSRQAIKKYVKANNKGLTTATDAQFDVMFNKALKTGVDKGDFTQPKGPSGPVKLAKKEAKPTAAKAAAPKKEPKEAKPKAASPTATTKKAAPKKAAPKPATTKKAPATKKTPAAKPKANTAKPRAKKTAKQPTTAPAVVDVPTSLTKTKSGRVTKTKQTAPTAAKKAAASKKTPTKKATPKKSATPKKTEAAA